MESERLHLDKCSFKHYNKSPLNDFTAQVCDATSDAISTTAGNKINLPFSITSYARYCA